MGWLIHWAGRHCTDRRLLGGAGRTRVVMRQKGSQRVILNANLWQGMIIKMMDGDKVGPEAAEPPMVCTPHCGADCCSAGCTDRLLCALLATAASSIWQL